MFFLLDDTFTLDNINNTLSKMKNREELLSILRFQVHEDRLEDWIKSHPCLSWSLLASTLLRANKKDAATQILQNHEFHLKGYHYYYVSRVYLCLCKWLTYILGLSKSHPCRVNWESLVICCNG